MVDVACGTHGEQGESCPYLISCGRWEKRKFVASAAWTVWEKRKFVASAAWTVWEKRKFVASATWTVWENRKFVISAVWIAEKIIEKYAQNFQ